ncbi:hypothetical protein G7Y89_g8369 [Cudoniella acicularis]|uniref:Carrier domain-containing protein n=1 Tax=Cudoniella acicularis TaxID=354080 RepID=A0A8H4W0N8_9HELO|nr:hypothetical protein G7Y89_g8369 [Cudoniella acicularis]
MRFQNLQQLLEWSVENVSNRKIVTYPLGDTQSPTVLIYPAILHEARQKCALLRSLDNFHTGNVVLLHLSDHLNGIIWFWASLYAGCIPAMSTPFSNNSGHRILHIEHLSKMLKDPLCITSERSLDQFSGQEFLRPITVESLEKTNPRSVLDDTLEAPSPENTALLMLTSGSTGNAKAVCLSHGQILVALAGKFSVIQLPNDGSFFNWIALDHVASIVEIHLQALFVGVDQIHVHAADIITNPVEFLHLIDQHRVSRTFAPNFFLSRLRKSLEKMDAPANWDLSCLRYLASGGEANVTETCAAVSSLLTKYGAPERTIVPGFGMTETCAGSIFNTNFPTYDIVNDFEFASVGHCMPGVEMRVTSDKGSLGVNEVGDLEVTGPVVFKEYFNNEPTTAEAFTKDGWFRTGDRALIDSSGHLILMGRKKDTLIVNGVKYNPEEIESAIEDARIPGVTSSFTVCFSSLRSSIQTEKIYVIFLPAYDSQNTTAHLDTLNAIITIVMMQTGARPEPLPLDGNVLQKSTLGKISRTKIKQAFERGDYAVYEELSKERMSLHKTLHNQKPRNQTEELLLGVFSNALQIEDGSFDVTTPIFTTGITSIELISLKRNIEEHLDLTSPIPIITLMTNPTIRSLVTALEKSSTKQEYEPVVTIQPHGTKNPLWLVHPGVGEVLVFLNLAKYFPDRPIYAFRARGFSKNESYFTDINDAIYTYHAAIKRRQPQGPYLLAGYSYGSMLAFEISKILESNGDEVGFLGVFNLPPHIKSRMRQLNWVECILHLSYFLELITEAQSQDLAAEFYLLPREEVFANILTRADTRRLAELSLTPIALINWANVAYALQSMAVNYEPSGSVAKMDVFYCTPLAVVAAKI